MTNMTSSNTRNNMKPQINNKLKYKELKNKYVEMLIPTLNKISSYQFLLIQLEGESHKQSSQNNQSA